MGANFYLLWHIMILNCCFGLVWSYLAFFGLIWPCMVLSGLVCPFWPHMVLLLLFTAMAMCVPIRLSMSSVSVVLYGILRSYISFYGLMWHFMVLCGILWSYMAVYDLIWHFMAENRFFFARGHRSKFNSSCLL